jgi:hypothetical protein
MSLGKEKVLRVKKSVFILVCSHFVKEIEWLIGDVFGILGAVGKICFWRIGE